MHQNNPEAHIHHAISGRCVPWRACVTRRSPVSPGKEIWTRPRKRMDEAPEETRGDGMEIRRKRGDTRPGPREWFTGLPYLLRVLRPRLAAELGEQVAAKFFTVNPARAFSWA